MSIVPSSAFMRGFLGILLPPILMICFCLAEGTYALYESGVLLLLGAFVISSVVLSIICLSRLSRTISPWVSFMLVPASATGPFWGTMIGVEPNVHGLSILLLFLYIVLAWGTSLYVIGAGVWRLVDGNHVR